MTKVKICGITNLDDARLAVGFGADMIGFNFFPGSTRFVDTGCAGSIVDRLTNPVIKVGVFVDQSIEDIVEVDGVVRLDAIQLHGNETPDFVDRLRKETDAEIIKVFRVGPKFSAKPMNSYIVDGILLDSYSKSGFGGTGEAFDWSVAADVARDSRALYLAGGLNPGNVAEAIRRVRPYAVDVASGVESSPRKKDPAKLEAFIRNAKEA